MDDAFVPSPNDPAPPPFTAAEEEAHESWVAALDPGAAVEIYTAIPFLGSSWEDGIVLDILPDVIVALGHDPKPHRFARNSPFVRPRR